MNRLKYYFFIPAILLLFSTVPLTGTGKNSLKYYKFNSDIVCLLPDRVNRDKGKVKPVTLTETCRGIQPGASVIEATSVEHKGFVYPIESPPETMGNQN